MSAREFSDEDLTAHLDGEADAALSMAIIKACENDTDLVKRLDELTIDTEAIMAAFDELKDSAPAMSALPAATTPAPRRWTGLAATAAAVVLGIGIGVFARSPQQLDGWMDYVAAYQALYVQDTVASLPQQDPANDANLVRVASVLGRDLKLPEGPSSLDYRRAQLLGFQGQPLVQLAFVSPSGAPIALCIIKNDGADTELELVNLEGLSTAYWRKNGFNFMLIGGTDIELIKKEADRFQKLL